MIQKLQGKGIYFGLAFTVASALLILGLSIPFFTEQRLQSSLFDCGVDCMGSLVCAALFYGCMKQKGDGSEAFRYLVLMVSASFVINELVYYTGLVPEQRIICFVFCLLSKLVDLVMIWYFYRYIRVTLGFEGKLARWADKGFPILMALEAIVLLSNIFYPVTFLVDAGGNYGTTDFAWAEDIYLAVVSVLTIILVIRCGSPARQKAAALMFICLPVLEYVLLGAQFGNAGQYGMILMSLVVMYCVIFNDKSSKLASTQTELNMATEIQASMLPSIFPAFPTRDEIDLYASMDPAKEVGGDFYDFFMIDDNHIGVVIADVSGKGVPAALFMMISKTIIQNFAKLGVSAAEVLTKSNEALCAQNKMKMFVTAWVGILDLSTGRMTCSSAGHEYPAIFHEGKFELLKDKHGLVLGAMSGVRYKDYEVQLDKGDKIFVYTDGVPEATNAHNELFGTDRMVEALNTDAEANPKDLLRIVREAVDAFVGGAEQFDDLTMLCLEYRGL